MLSGGQVAGLIVAMFWAILVCFLAVVLLRLARLLGETTKMIAHIGDHAAPLLDDMTKTVEQAGEQLDRVDTITRNMAGVTQNVSAVSTVVTSVVGNPLVKAAAFSYGVRRALGNRPQSASGGPVTDGRVVPNSRVKAGSRRGAKGAPRGATKGATKNAANSATKTAKSGAVGK
jgi:hypothetical protein